MRETIAWIDRPAPHGTWGPPDALCLPLNDRTPLLADGLFETLLVEAGQPLLLEAHLQRWTTAAALLGLPSPPCGDRVRALLREAVARSGIAAAPPTSGGAESWGALRLDWSRGSGPGRGIDLPDPADSASGPRFWLQLSRCRPCFDPVTVIVSRRERRNAHSLLSRCKTVAYGQAVQARREARADAAEDALLLSTEGDLCCGTVATLLLRREGRWRTPPLASGCLPGVMRARALATGLAREARLGPEELDHCDAALLINSLGCRPIRRCDHRILPVPTATEAHRLWRGLLESSPGATAGHPTDRSGVGGPPRQPELRSDPPPHG